MQNTICKIIGQVCIVSLMLVCCIPASKMKKKVKITIGIACWIGYMVTLTAGIFHSSQTYGEQIIAKEQYREWPVIMLENQEIIDPTVEKITLKVDGRSTKTLIGKYYEYTEGQLYENNRDTEKSNYIHIKTKVYKCTFGCLKKYLWQELLKEEENLLPLKEDRLIEYGVDEGWIEENGRSMYLKKGAFIVKIKGTEKIIKSIQENGQLQECLAKLENRK